MTQKMTLSHFGCAPRSHLCLCLCVCVPMSCVALIGGSSLAACGAAEALVSAGARYRTISTPFGPVRLLELRFASNRSSIDRFVCVQRHAVLPDHRYSLPHTINNKAIFHALKNTLNVSAVIGLGSVGSLRVGLNVGSVMVPDDYYNPNNIEHFSYDASAHITPGFDEELRTSLLRELESLMLSERPCCSVLQSGVYIQTTGPRFETKSEIKEFSRFADVVGMTCATESTLAKELNIPYALACVVDNMGNGIAPSALDLQSFQQAVKQNSSLAGLVFKAALRALQVDDIVPVERDEADASRSVDLIVNARFVVPVQPHHVLENHAIAVDKGVIVAIGPIDDIAAQYRASETVDRMEHALMPGLVNCHTHLGITTLRGLADDRRLMEWLQNHVWPVETKVVDSEFTQDNARLALVELIRSGTTCFNDMYFFPEDTGIVATEVGIRAVISAIMFEFPTAYGSGPESYLESGRKLRAQFAEGTPDNPHGLITTTLTPHAVYTVSDKNLAKVAKLSEELNLRVHMHLHETRDEVVDSEQLKTESPSCHLSSEAVRPILNLSRLGLVNSRLIAVHMTELNEDDMRLLEQSGASVVHCPASNLKLASGFCRVNDLLQRNINVAIGTDSACSNNQLDMFAEMKLAALLAKGFARDPTAVSAHVALEMATINGAKALDLQDKIGTLEVGKRADFIALDFSAASLTPVYDVVSHIVYAADGHSVTDVWVNGKCLMDNRMLTTIDEAAVKKKAIEWSHKVQAVHAEANKNK